MPSGQLELRESSGDPATFAFVRMECSFVSSAVVQKENYYKSQLNANRIIAVILH